MDNPEKAANEIIHKAISRLKNTSDSWQIILQQTKEELIEAGHTTIANDVNTVISNAIQDSSAEAKCFVDFIRSKLEDDLKRIAAKITGNSITLVPHFCTPSHHSINYNDIEKGLLASFDISGYNLDYSKIKVFLISQDGSEKDISTYLANPTEYLITLNISTNGAQITPCSNKLRFDLQNNNSFTVNILHPKRTKNITPLDQEGLCPKRCGGDKEFGGNGPKVDAKAVLFLKNERELWVRISLKAIETKHDYTCTEREWEFLVKEAPQNFKITNFSPTGPSIVSYIDSNHQLDSPPIKGSALVRKFEIMGDTKGNDTGNCTPDDVFINVFFNPVSITYESSCN